MKPKIILMYCLFLASAFCLFAAAQTNQSKTPKKAWPPDPADPNSAEVKNAKAAFTATLTRSGYDHNFRNSLTISCDSAKKSVSDEGKIEIPDKIIIMFFESDAIDNHFGFLLPPLNEQAHTPYKYTDDDYYQCCFRGFRKFLMRRTEGPMEGALNAAMTRAGYDPEFRKRLTVSCDSAKKAVSEEGHVEIPKEVQMIFHEPNGPGDEGNDHYHIFELPPFNPNSKKQQTYETYFRGLYRVW